MNSIEEIEAKQIVIKKMKSEVLTIPCVIMEETLFKQAEEGGIQINKKQVNRKRKYGPSFAINSWFYSYNEMERKPFKNSSKFNTADKQIEQLVLKCYRKKASSTAKRGKLFEVEYIIDMKILEGKRYYLIKWVDWPIEANTWECFTNLRCRQLITDFHADYNQQLKKFMTTKKLWKSFVGTQSKLYKEKVGVNARILNSIPNGFQYISTYHLQKMKQRDTLKEWEERVNQRSNRKPIIAVENEVDLAILSDSFTYINENIAGEGVFIPTDPLIGCECKNCALVNGKICSCLPSNHHRPNYDAGLVKVKPGKPIYECNSRCLCSASCSNRIVQRGTTTPLSVFRTANGKGWGVKTLKSILKGMFVMEYVGEVITNSEAEKRGMSYDADGITYLFDLDYHETENPLTVDATNYGNVSHFVNHSCAPNLQVYNVFVDNMDPSLPRIALFAKRNIAENEELTFDYQMTGATEDMDEAASSKNGEEEPEIDVVKIDEEDNTIPSLVELPNGFDFPEENNLISNQLKMIKNADQQSDRASSTSGQRIPCFCEAKQCRGWLLC